MGFNYVFGGDPVQPAQVAYQSFTITSDLNLQWPWAESDTEDAVAVIVEIDAQNPGLSVTMPAADQASVGQPAMIRNIGAIAFTVRQNDGGTLITIDPGIAKYIYITDNSTAGGTWSNIQFGAGASSADAASLAGMGLRARNQFLDQDHPVTVIVGDTDIDSSYRAQLLSVSPSTGTGTIQLPVLADVEDGFFFLFSNLGTGAWSVLPDGGQTIDNQSVLEFNPLESAEIHAGATGWYTVGRGRNSTFAFTMNVQSVAGNSDVTLTTTQAGNFIQRYFGALTGNINVIVPNAVQPYIVANATTGAFSLTVKTATGTGVIITQGETVWLYCDGTDVLDADTEVPSAPALDMPDGTAAAPGLAFTLQPNNGIYRPGSNQFGIAVGGQATVNVSSAGVEAERGSFVMGSTDIRMLMTVLG